jgi:hypothetical protein
MFGTSWRVGRIAGIEVRVDSSWVGIAGEGSSDAGGDLVQLVVGVSGEQLA